MNLLFLVFLGFTLLAGDDPDIPNDQLQRWDEKMGIVPNPGGHGFSNAFDPPLEYKLNSLGYRDEEFGQKQKSIVAFGASYTFGTGIRAEDRWSEILERRICNAEVRNISVAGYFIDQNYVLLKRVLDQGMDSKLIVYEPPHFNGEKLHLSMQGWGPFSRKPFLKFDGEDEPEIVYGDVPISFSLPPGESETSLYTSFAAGYNKLLFDWILFPKTEKASIQKAEKIILATYNLAKRHGKDMIFVVHEEKMSAVIKTIGLEDRMVRVTDFEGKYKVSEEIGHVNPEGNRIIADRVLGKLRDMGKLEYLCER